MENRKALLIPETKRTIDCCVCLWLVVHCYCWFNTAAAWYSHVILGCKEPTEPGGHWEGLQAIIMQQDLISWSVDCSHPPSLSFPLFLSSTFILLLNSFLLSCHSFIQTHTQSWKHTTSSRNTDSYDLLQSIWLTKQSYLTAPVMRTGNTLPSCGMMRHHIQILSTAGDFASRRSFKCCNMNANQWLVHCCDASLSDVCHKVSKHQDIRFKVNSMPCGLLWWFPKAHRVLSVCYLFRVLEQRLHQSIFSSHLVFSLFQQTFKSLE